MKKNRNAEMLATVHTHTHTSRFRKIIAVGLLATIVTTSVCIFALINKENVVYGAEEASSRFNPETLQDNEHMHVEIDESGEKVPVPNGYVGSKVAGENEIDTGYVIYEGTEEVNDSNVEEAQKTRNQYVWIPVPDASKMYGTDENGKKWGKLYDFTTEEGEGIDPVTGAKPLNWSESAGIYKNTSLGMSEPEVGAKVAIIAIDMDSRIKTEKVESDSTHSFLVQLEQEFCGMLNSIEKYGGFYVGRYETGDLSKDKSVIRKFNEDIGSQTWYTIYKKCKKLSNGNENIETGIIWGSQRDRILMWLIESGNKAKADIATNSINWGNYRDSEFEYLDINNNTMLKTKSSEVRIPTGSSEFTKANNIYDLAGNVSDLTMSVKNRLYKEYRGGNYQDKENSEIVTAELGAYSYQALKYMRMSSNVVYKIKLNF